MRILYLINSVEGGGAELAVPRIAKALARRGAHTKVFALTRRDGRALIPYRKAGLSCAVREGGRRDHAAAYRWILQILREEQPDVLWTSLTRATVLGQRAAASLGIPVVSWQHAVHLKPRSAFILRWQQRMTSLWIGDSQKVTDLTRHRLRVEPERLLNWPLFAADADAPVARPWDGERTFCIGSLGRLHRIKGYDVLAEAIQLLDRQGFRAPVDWEVLIAGEGDERESLSKLSRDVAGGRMKLIGYQPDRCQFLATLHGYVQPSRSEGFCVAAHEAMQAGLPIIASAVGDMADSVEPGRSGWLVRPRKAADLADALAAMLSDPAGAALKGQAAREVIFSDFGEEQFNATAATIVERLDALVRARRVASDEASGRPA